MVFWKFSFVLACGNIFVFKFLFLILFIVVMLGEVYKEVGFLDGCYNII